MISHLKGIIEESHLEKESTRIVVDVSGVGYEALMTKASFPKLEVGQSIKILVSEATTAYDGNTTLYGFLTLEEKEIFSQIRDHVGGVGPKKSLDCIDKISKSLPDFKRAVIEGDVPLLVSVFGFTKKMAEKLAFSLKSKIESWSIQGNSKWTAASSSTEGEALSGLVNLGYKEAEAREMIAQAKAQLGKNAETAALLQHALRLSHAK